MNKIIQGSVFAIAATIGSTGLYAADADKEAKKNNNETKFSIEIKKRESRERNEDKALLAHGTNYLSSYIVLNKELSTDITGTGISLDTKSSINNFEMTKGKLGKHQDNVYFSGGFRYFSGEETRRFGSSSSVDEENSYLALMAGVGYMRDLTDETPSINEYVNVRIYVGAGLAYASYEQTRDQSWNSTVSKDTDSGIGLHYNSGLIFGIQSHPELELELGFQSLPKGSIMHEYFIRADYDLSKKIDVPISLSGRFDIFDGSLSMGASYRF